MTKVSRNGPRSLILSLSERIPISGLPVYMITLENHLKQTKTKQERNLLSKQAYYVESVLSCPELQGEGKTTDNTIYLHYLSGETEFKSANAITNTSPKHTSLTLAPRKFNIHKIGKILVSFRSKRDTWWYQKNERRLLIIF